MIPLKYHWLSRPYLKVVFPFWEIHKALFDTWIQKIEVYIKNLDIFTAESSAQLLAQFSIIALQDIEHMCQGY